jgi:hypothetical protein
MAPERPARYNDALPRRSRLPTHVRCDSGRERTAPQRRHIDPLPLVGDSVGHPFGSAATAVRPRLTAPHPAARLLTQLLFVRAFGTLCLASTTILLLNAWLGRDIITAIDGQPLQGESGLAEAIHR